MAVKLRMTRMGRRHRPFFRINAVESRTPRDGKILEKLGHYDPIEKDPAKQVVLNRERTEYWLEKGAIPSDSVSQILLRAGLKHKYAEEKASRRAKARAIAGAKGKMFTKAQRIAAQKQAEAAEEKAKAEAAEAKAKVEAEAKAKAEEKIKAEAEAKLESEANPETETSEEKVEAETEPVEEKAEAEAAAKEEPEAKAKEEPEGRAKEEAENKADEEKAE